MILQIIFTYQFERSLSVYISGLTHRIGFETDKIICVREGTYKYKGSKYHGATVIGPFCQIFLEGLSVTDFLFYPEEFFREFATLFNSRTPNRGRVFVLSKTTEHCPRCLGSGKLDWIQRTQSSAPSHDDLIREIAKNEVSQRIVTRPLSNILLGRIPLDKNLAEERCEWCGGLGYYSLNIRFPLENLGQELNSAVMRYRIKNEEEPIYSRDPYQSAYCAELYTINRITVTNMAKATQFRGRW
jgi:hypothetical protein